MGLFSRSAPPTFSDVTGEIDRISEMGRDHMDFDIRLVGSPTIYSVFWNSDGKGGQSLYMAKPGDRVTLSVQDGTTKARSIVNHSF